MWLWIACGHGGPDTDASDAYVETDDTDCEAQPWYPDADRDTHGAIVASTLACERPDGFVAVADDCDDANWYVHPGADEIRGDGIDQDCSGEDLPSLEPPTWPDRAPIAPCPAYSGVLGVGTTNTLTTTPYAIDDCSDFRSWSVARRISGMEGDDTERTFEIVTTGVQGTTCYYTHRGEDRAKYRCDAVGLWLLSRTAEFSNGAHWGGGAGDRDSFRNRFEIVFEGDGLLVLPADPDATPSWTSAATATATLHFESDDDASDPYVEDHVGTYANVYDFTATRSVEELAFIDIGNYFTADEDTLPPTENILDVTVVRTGDDWPVGFRPPWMGTEDESYSYEPESYYAGHLGWLHRSVGPTLPSYSAIDHGPGIWQTVDP